MPALRIGILGAARIAPKAVIDPARVIPSVSVTAIAARDPDRALDFAQRFDIARVHDSYEALISDPEIDLIYNPLPINLHATWTIKALQTGKHVLCEKPFAMNSDESNAMLAAAAASGKRLVEAFHYRYHPAFATCLDWLRDGQIGRIREISATFNVTIPDNGTEIRHRVETGGGAMMDLGCYPLHWVLSLLDNDPVGVEALATLTPVGVDETMTASLRFPGDIKAKLETSMAADTPFAASLKIVGDHGDIDFTNPLAPHLGGKLRMTANGSQVSAEISPISTYTYQLAALVGAIKTGSSLPTEGAMIARQQAALDAIYTAAGLQSLRWR